MTALQLVGYVNDAIYVLIAVIVAAQALRAPTRPRLDVALYFAGLAFIVLESLITTSFGLATDPVVDDIVIGVLLAVPYLLLRLVDDFAPIRTWVKRAAEVGLVACVAAFALVPTPTPPPLILGIVIYFFAVSAYNATAFVRFAARSTGVTHRRMQAVAAGSFLLGATLLAVGFGGILPSASGAIDGIVQVLGLAAGLGFFAGFAPPTALLRAWEEPELRRFLERAARLPRLEDTGAIVAELEDGAARTMGAGAMIGLWDQNARVLRFANPHGVVPPEVGESAFMVWRVFRQQRALFVGDPQRANPANAAAYRQHDVAAMLIAPISAGDERLGVLAVYTSQRPIFSESDLELVQLLADQAAVILESRSLIDEAARVRAHEQATRLKDDFLSAAAHDLKTPLTTLVAQAQFLERRAEQEPSAPADLGGIRRIVKEARRLSTLVTELLDASRLERGALVGEREPVDLVALAREVAAREVYRSHRVTLEADGPVVGQYDGRRIGQVIENLVENAVKYSPESSPVRVAVGRDNGLARIAIADEGIGIPLEDLSQVFERFHRASNVDDRRFAGMGLGLFICKGIVEQHGGRIWVESTLGTGTTFHVSLPLEGRA